MTPLIEVHDEGDLEMALSCDPKILGVNARDLNSLEVSVDKASELLKKVPEGIVRVAESGVTDKDKLLKLKESGADAFLIGTALMRDPEKIKELIR
jgi:indole-3-glycerol phosphate synthase